MKTHFLAVKISYRSYWAAGREHRSAVRGPISALGGRLIAVRGANGSGCCRQPIVKAIGPISIKVAGSERSAQENITNYFRFYFSLVTQLI